MGRNVKIADARTIRLDRLDKSTSSQYREVGYVQIKKKNMSVGKAIIKFSGGKIMNLSRVRVVDLRSDTLTMPTPEMRQAMASAQVGDDVYREDPTVEALQNKVSRMLGKEASLFVASGAMGNLLAAMSHCDRRCSEMIIGDQTHVYHHEQGAPAYIAGIQINTVENKHDGTFDLDEMQRKIREDDIHAPYTSLISVENTHSFCGGKALPLNWLDELAQRAKKFGIPLHMDGARLFNASVALDVPVSRIVKDFDSVSFCISKGLCAPVGAVLSGTERFIEKARRFRKGLGGGWRQAGVLAAAGIVGLDKIVPRLSEDHARAARIAQAINNFGSEYIHADPIVQTNIVMISTRPPKLLAEQLLERMETVTEEEYQELQEDVVVIKSHIIDEKNIRIVTYLGITDEDVDLAVQKFQYIAKEVENMKT